MATQYGTNTILDSLATYDASNVLAFGEENLAGFMQQILDVYNSVIAELLTSDLVGVVPERETTYGTDSTAGEMVDLDEVGLADAQKVPFSQSPVGFPLRKRGYTVQYTRDYLAVTSPREFLNQVLRATEADKRKFYTDIRRALFNSSNNTAYRDRLIDNRNYTLKALVNADSAAIPPQPVTGATFNAASHTHYLATASFIEANLVSLYETVREHGLGSGSIRVYINSAQEATVRAFAGFQPYVDPRMSFGGATTHATGTVDFTNLEDRAIGFHGPAEIWVKWWIPASYLLAFIWGGDGQPVLGWRKPEGGMAQFAELRLAAELDRYPLHANAWERRFGISAWNRTRAAVLYTASGTYANLA